MHICAGCDDTYAPVLSAMVCSFIAHLDRNQAFVLYVIEDMSGENKDRIRSIVNRSSGQVEFIAADLIWLGEYEPAEYVSHLSKLAYARLLIGDLLPQGVSKAIYLDCDTIVQHNLAELWQIGFGDKHLLVVEDAFVTTVSHESESIDVEALHLDPYQKYFNSGVLVIDLIYWRASKIAQRMMEYIVAHKEALHFADQTVFNIFFGTLCKFIDTRWNVPPYTKRSVRTLLQKPFIIHYCTGSKPWKHDYTSKYKFRFYKYAQNHPAHMSLTVRVALRYILARIKLAAMKVVKRF